MRRAQLLLNGAGGDANGEGVRELLTDLEEEVLEKQAKAMLETDLQSGSLPEISENELREGAMAQQVEDELDQLKKKLLTARREDEGPTGSSGTSGTSGTPGGSGEDDVLFIK